MFDGGLSDYGNKTPEERKREKSLKKAKNTFAMLRSKRKKKR